MSFQVMAKPSGARCNMDCTYCFYTEKKDMYGSQATGRMSPELLELFIRQYIESQNTAEVVFAWQGGEPTLLGVDYFNTIVTLQQKFRGIKKISNTLQTNGTLLTDDWCRFFKKHRFLVGISIDGPQEIHDKYRVDKEGSPSFDRVIRGIELLKKHGINFNLLTVINDHNSEYPHEVYNFLKKVGDGHIQFIPIVERIPTGDSISPIGLAPPPTLENSAENTIPLSSWSVTPEKLAGFYTAIFDKWIRNDVGKTFVQFFDVALGNWLGAGSGLCQFSPSCGTGGALEHNGDLFPCDHYVFPQYKIGNIMNAPLAGLMNSVQQRGFGQAKSVGLAEYCKKCEVLSLCYGDCPKHRFKTSPDGRETVSYLCEAYKKIFTHMTKDLDLMADLIRSGNPARDVMDMLNPDRGKEHGISRGRNSTCPCGSGKKFKKCCGAL